MHNKLGLLNEAISIIEKALSKNLLIEASFNNAFDFYDDASGQRENFLTHNTFDMSMKYDSVNSDKYKGSYRILRSNSFENDVDKMKDLSTLGIIHLDVNKVKTILINKSIEKIYLEFDSIKLIIYLNKENKKLSKIKCLKKYSKETLLKHSLKTVNSLGYKERFDLIEELKK